MNQPTRTGRWLRWVAAAVVALSLGPLLFCMARLPEPLATHWGPTGQPDSALPWWVFFAVEGALAGLAAWLLAAPRGDRRARAQHGGFLGVTAAGVSALVVYANLDAPSWAEARPITLLHALPLIGLSSGAAWLFGRLLPRAPVEPAGFYSVGLEGGERAVYFGTTKSPLFRIGAAAALIAAAAFAWGGSTEVACVVGFVGLVFVPLSEIRLRVDGSALQVRYGPLPFPRQTFALEAIQQADVIDVRPLEWGGWGYRGSVRLFGKAAVVLRQGPALKLTFADGGVWVVTCDNPATVAGLIQDLRR